MRIIIVGAIILLISSFQLQARNLKLRFEKLGINQGLSHSTVTAIHLDHQGFLWFGTQDGLNRYDGYKFSIFRNDNADSNSISNNWITSITEDKNGYLWIGTSGGGVNRFDPNLEKFSSYIQASEKKVLNNNYIIQVVADSNNDIWIISADGNLHKFNSGTNSFEPVKIEISEKGTLFSVMAAGYDSSLWLGTLNSGLIRYNTKTQKFKEFHATDLNSLCDERINDIFIGKDRIIWIATRNGLSRLNPGTQKFTSYAKDLSESKGLLENDIKKIFVDSHKTLWVSTESGLNLKYPGEKSFNTYRQDQNNLEGLGTNVINTIFEDDAGIIWIGTYLDGINKFDRSKNLFTHFINEPENPNSLSANNIWSVFEDKQGSIWIGTNKGLNQYLPRDNYFKHFMAEEESGKLNNNTVRTICQDKYGNIWCGTDGGGINRLNVKSGKFSYYQHDPKNEFSLADNKIKHLYKDREQNIWIATWNGLDRYDAKQNIFIHSRYNPDKLTSICDNRVQCILEDKQGQIWIGTYDGLNMMDRSSGQCTWYKNDPQKAASISDNRILCLYEDKNGTLWIGTYHGLNKLNKDKGSFTRYTRQNGLINDVIQGIVEDESGKLWLSTNKGLIQYDPQKPEYSAFINYDTYDGLSGNEFNTGAYLKSRDGYFYFGCENGLNKFMPSQVQINQHIAPIVITAFKKFDKNIHLEQATHFTKKINLSYKDNFFAFEFAALDFVNPHKNQYAYKLEGFDEKWIACGTRNYASYTNLDGGNYTFCIRGSNNDGVWNQDTATIDIDIAPPYWKTWWFMTICIVSTLFVVTFIVWYWQRRERLQRERLKLQVDDRTQDVLASLKKLRKAQNEAKNLSAKTKLLYDIGQRISSQLDLDVLLNNIVVDARDTFNYYNVTLFLLDKKRKGLLIKSISGGYEKIYPEDMFIELGKGLVGKAAYKKETQLTNNISHSLNYLTFEGDVTKSELTIPIISKAGLIGVLDIQSNKLDEFTNSDKEVFETFCSQIAAAINNANLFEQLEKELKERKKAEEQLRESWDLLIKAKKETDNIFKNIEEGLFQINSRGEIGAQYSKSLENILKEKDLAGKLLTDLIHNKIPEKIYKSTIEYIELMFDEGIDEDTLLELNPLYEIELSQNDADDKKWIESVFLVFKFKRSHDNTGKISALIISVNDVTEQKKLALQLEKTEAEQKKQVEWMFSILHVDPSLLREFMEVSKKDLNDITSLLKSTKSPDEYNATVEKILRVMGNLRASASLLEIKLFERKAQKFEDSIQRMLRLEKLEGADFISLVIQLEEMRSIINEIEIFVERLASIHSTFKTKKKTPKETNSGNLITI